MKGRPLFFGNFVVVLERGQDLYVVTFMSTFSFSCVSFCFSYVYLRIMGIHKIVGFEQKYASNALEKKEREGETTYLHCFTCPWCHLWG